MSSGAKRPDEHPPVHLVLGDSLLDELAERLAHGSAAGAERFCEPDFTELLTLLDPPLDDRRTAARAAPARWSRRGRAPRRPAAPACRGCAGSSDDRLVPDRRLAVLRLLVGVEDPDALLGAEHEGARVARRGLPSDVRSFPQEPQRGQLVHLAVASSALLSRPPQRGGRSRRPRSRRRARRGNARAPHRP